MKTRIFLIAASLLFFAASLFGTRQASPFLFYLSFVILSFPVFAEALAKAARGRLFDENVLMAITSVSCLMLGDVREGYSVIFFFSLGELFYAVTEKCFRSTADHSDHDHDAEKPLSKFAAVYTPTVVVLAAVVLAIRVFVMGDGTRQALEKALGVLVLSCPCPLVLAIPLCYLFAFLSLRRKGIVLSGMDELYCVRNNDPSLDRAKRVCRVIIAADIAVFIALKTLVFITSATGMTSLFIATFSDIGILVLEAAFSALPLLLV